MASVALSKKQMRTEIELLIVTMDEQKAKNRQIQNGMAEKIVKLEETIDFVKEEHEERLA